MTTKPDYGFWFNFMLLLGSFGFFHREGSMAMNPSWWPQAKVKYKSDGRLSGAMPIGTAVIYANIFKGDVVPAWVKE